jgi:hypothetical protein
MQYLRATAKSWQWQISGNDAYFSTNATSDIYTCTHTYAYTPASHRS